MFLFLEDVLVAEVADGILVCCFGLFVSEPPNAVEYEYNLALQAPLYNRIFTN